jgi:REP element-mobilizing transposase RayT
MDLKSSSHGYGQLMYHLEWTLKYRYEMFRKQENAKLCEDIIREIAKRWQIGVAELSVMIEQVHCVVEL